MKRILQKRILAFVLVLTMLLPNVMGLLTDVYAVTTRSNTYGEANVYDISDLTGSNTNIV